MVAVVVELELWQAAVVMVPELALRMVVSG